MIIVTATIRTTPENRDILLEESIAHCIRSRSEPGCIAHNVHSDAEDPSRLVFVEYWEDESALKAHFMVPASRNFANFIRGHAAEPPEMLIYSANIASL